MNDCELPQVLSSKQPVDLFTLEEDREEAYSRIRRSMEVKFDLVSGKAAESKIAHYHLVNNQNKYGYESSANTNKL